MSVDITNIAYLGFRLAPFIIVFYFVFQTVINFEVRGCLYIAGLLLSASIIYACNSPLLALFPPKSYIVTKNAKCNIISLGDNGDLLSEIPLSIAVYTYTYIYLLMFMIAIDSNVTLALKQNIPTLVIFPILCAFEIFWIVSNNCIENPLYLIIASIIISGGVAALWGMMVISIKNKRLYYTNNADIGQYCDRPSKTLFKCKPLRV